MKRRLMYDVIAPGSGAISSVPHIAYESDNSSICKVRQRTNGHGKQRFCCSIGHTPAPGFLAPDPSRKNRSMPHLPLPKSRRAKIALAAAGLLVAVPATAIIVLLNADWNRAKPWLSARTSEALGRPIAIDGDLTLAWRQEGNQPGWRGVPAGRGVSRKK